MSETRNVMGFEDDILCGQRLMAGFNGHHLNDELRILIARLKVGGVILFSRNIESAEQVKTLCDSIQNYAKEQGVPPLFIAIDQEGGEVSRLKPPFTQFPLGNPGLTSFSDVDSFVAATASELTSIGVNMNMAPVMDVQPEGFCGIMDRRVFPGGPERVAELGCRMIDGFQKQGVLAVAKHFPGIGRTVLDSHLVLPTLECDSEQFMETDLIPFKAAIRHDVSGIMLSHIKYSFFDSKWPASLSEKIVSGILRNTLGYQGIVMTDDLDMKAIEVDIDVSIDRMLDADVDMALICHYSTDIETAAHLLQDQFKNSDELKKKRFYNSVQRIMDAKAVLT